MTQQSVGVLLPSKIYNVLKAIALVILPLLATMFLGLAALYGAQVFSLIAGTITLIDTFLGGILKASSTNYATVNDKSLGVIEVGHNEEDGMLDDPVIKPYDPNGIVFQDREKAVFDVRRVVTKPKITDV